MCGNWLSRVFSGFGFTGMSGRMFGRTAASGVSRKKRALLVIDVQNDFISGSLALSGCPSKHNGEEVVPVINKFVTSPFWDLVVYSKDWHPADHISFVTNAETFDPHEENTLDFVKANVHDVAIFDVEGTKVEQALWPAHCIQNSAGAELHKDLIVTEGCIIVHKGINRDIDSYSAFFDNNRRSETILRQVLQDNNVSQVYVCGLATDVCVNFTTFDSHSLGFETFLIEDACRGVVIENCEKTVQKMKEAGIEVVTSDDVLQRASEAVK